MNPASSPMISVPGMPATLEQFWSDRVRRIDAELERLLPGPDEPPQRLHAAMRHAVMAGGKRLRPILTAAVHDALGGQHPAIDAVGAAIEMLHTYSLIHDDLPCMDDDDQRRGQPTVHVAFDEATAVLAGDALHVLAFEILADVAPLAVLREITRAIGTTGMLGGQMADLEAEGTVATEEVVANIHRRKTGALIIASATAGAHLAGAPEQTVGKIAEYARPLGLAFQIVDDLLEVTGDAERLGKSTTSDSKHHKVTYPAALGVDASWARARRLADEARAALAQLPNCADTSILGSLAEFIVIRDH